MEKQPIRGVKLSSAYVIFLEILTRTVKHWSTRIHPSEQSDTMTHLTPDWFHPSEQSDTMTHLTPDWFHPSEQSDTMTHLTPDWS